MKNIFSYVWNAVPKKTVTVVAALVAGLAFSAVTFAGFGPDRPTQAWTPQQNGFQYVTFNSFTGVPNGIGDERDFLRGVQVGRDATWADPVNSITNDAEIEAKIYIHNNADPLLNDAGGNPGIARNVSVKVELPTGTAAAQDIKATINSSNAQPTSIFDTLSMTGVNGSVFQLAYVPGSAKMVAEGQTTPISDSLVTTGVNLPDQKGCFQYIREITFRMKVQKPGYQVRKSARLAGEGADKWRETVNAKVGDKVEWRIFFQNIGSTQLNNVKIVDDVPPYMTVVPGTVELVNSNFPNGYKYPNSAIQANGRQVNVDIDDYAPRGGAYLYFFTTIDNVEQLKCGTTQLQNVAYATPEGYGAVNDGAFVNVLGGECQPSQPQVACKAVNVTKLGGRKVKVDVSTLANPADRAKVKNFTYNFGDGSTPLVTTDASREYTYSKDGTFKIAVKVTFTVDGQDKVVEGAPCEAMVTFESGKPTTPPVLPNTGAGSVLGLLTATTIAGAVAHRFWTLRKN